MIRYIIKRILWLIPVIIAVSFVVYSLLELAPGTIIDTMMSESMTTEDVAALRAQYDLDKPMIYRYGKYMVNLVQGNLGVSYVSGMSVWKMYISRLPNTLLLSFTALIIGSAIAVPMGIRAARRAGTLTDNMTTTFTLIGMSMPGFWVGLLLLLVFSLKLGWFPGGRFEHGIRSLVLPAVCSGLVMMASATRQTRSSMLEVLNADYLRTARAKGVPEKAVIRKHALGNAMIPILTALGGSLCVQLAGSVVVESVFAWPGVGRMAAEAVLARDVPTTLGCVILTTMMYVFVQLIVDLLYALVDPRIKSQYVNAGKKKKRPASEEAMHAAKPAEVSETEALPETQYAIPDIAEPLILNDVKPEQTVIEVVEFEQTEVTDAACAEDDTSRLENNTAYSEAEAVSESVKLPVPDRKSSAFLGSTNPYNNTADALVSQRYRKRSMLGEVFHRLIKNKGTMVGLIIISLLLITFIASLFLINYEMITEPNVPARFTSPNGLHLFGTDKMGRDLFTRVIYGARYSLAIGFGSALIAVVFGVALGSLAGYYGGIVDDVIMRCSDVLASIPGMLLGMVIVTVMGQNLQNLIIAVGVTAIPVFIRITRASILTVKNNEFVEAAKSIGLPTSRIIFSQVLPNGLSPVIVAITSNLGMSMIIAASLSFLGFGVPVPHPEWGALVSEGRTYIRNAPWLTTFPGLFIMLTVLAFNMIGDGLRDALDPKLKR